MKVSLAEFKTRIDNYLELAGEEEIVLTKDGKYFAKIIPAPKSFGQYLDSIQGILPETATVEEARDERVVRLS